MMPERIVVTGYSALTAVGNTVQDSWAAIKAGQTGIAPLTRYDASQFEYPLVGELKSYQPKQMIPDRKWLKVLSRHDVIGLNAVIQAVEHSALLPYRDSLSDAKLFNDRTGIFVGSPGNKFNQEYDFLPLIAKGQGSMDAFSAHLFEEVHPMWLLRILPNNVLAYTGMHYGFKGANHNITNHALSSLQAILEAMHAIRKNQIDRAVVVGYESECHPHGLMHYGGMGLLSAQGLKSFDAKRNGTVLAEGAGALVLERASSAKTRGAQSYGEVLGGSVVSEAKGLLPLDSEGDGLSRAISNTLHSAQLSAEHVAVVAAHANGTVRSDASEAAAIRMQLGANIPVAGFKWALGHTLAAAGVLETIFTLMALSEQKVPGIASLTHVASDCQGIGVSANEQALRGGVGLVLARGFGSVNGGLMVRGFSPALR